MSLRSGGETTLAVSFTSPGKWRGHGARQSSTEGWGSKALEAAPACGMCGGVG